MRLFALAMAMGLAWALTLAAFAQAPQPAEPIVSPTATAPVGCEALQSAMGGKSLRRPVSGRQFPGKIALKITQQPAGPDCTWKGTFTYDTTGSQCDSKAEG